MGGIAGNLKALTLQEEEHSALERDLENQLVRIVFKLLHKSELAFSTSFGPRSSFQL